MKLKVTKVVLWRCNVCATSHKTRDAALACCRCSDCEKPLEKIGPGITRCVPCKLPDQIRRLRRDIAYSQEQLRYYEREAETLGVKL